ncbi:MAG: HAMP domain-containing protein, partial [Nitrosopumilus sp.]|nr:HAMP domain-containing protein [Nitrosopumilus sp.]
MRISTILKPYLPKSLLGRAILIIVTPLILLQVITTIIFFENHWSNVSRRLAQGVSGNISFVIEQMEKLKTADELEKFYQTAERNFSLAFYYEQGAVLDHTNVPSGIKETALADALEGYLQKPFNMDSSSSEDYVVVRIQLSEGVLSVTVPSKRLFSTTTYVFVMWMVGSSLLLFGVATIFMKNQVRPIIRLAAAADAFGKGRDSKKFKPEGALEVRRASSAFIAMRNRLKRHMQQRTDMLSGVSHDLRTPITRMKLQLAMMAAGEGTEELKSDISDMEHMLDEYLAFARGEGSEKPEAANINEMLEEIVTNSKRKGAKIDLHCEGEVSTTIRKGAIKRALTNLIENAARYGEHVTVRAALRENSIEIVIDDDGPGIPEEQREEVF